MLEFLFHMGVITVAGRRGREKLWDLTERWLPQWTPKVTLSDAEVEYLGAQLSLKALGVATPKQVAQHFLIDRYGSIKKTFASLEENHKVIPVELADARGSGGKWYIHSEDLPMTEAIAKGDWEPRTTLLSPFDNLISDRDRTNELFDFFYKIEIYTPKELRKTGFYVLPILDGDRLVGRIGPLMDRKKETLQVKAVQAEPDLSSKGASARRISEAIDELGDFLGATRVAFSGKIPELWRSSLK